MPSHLYAAFLFSSWSVWRLTGFRLSPRSFLGHMLLAGPDLYPPSPIASAKLFLCSRHQPLRVDSSLHPPCWVFLKMSRRLGRVGELRLCLFPGTCGLGGAPSTLTAPGWHRRKRMALWWLQTGAGCGAGLLCLSCVMGDSSSSSGGCSRCCVPQPSCSVRLWSGKGWVPRGGWQMPALGVYRIQVCYTSHTCAEC